MGWVVLFKDIKDYDGPVAGTKRGSQRLFNGGVYEHSNAAHNLLSTMRVAVIRGGYEVEIWKQTDPKHNKIVNDSKGQRIVRAGDQVTKTETPVASAYAA